MALTRKFLSAMGIENEKVDEIIAAHSETVNALKEERDSAKEEAKKYKAEAEKIPGMQDELEQLRKKDEAESSDSYEAKYNELKAEYEKYKHEQEEKAERNAKEKAYKEMLRGIGVSEKRLDAILKVTDLNSVELDADKNIKEQSKHEESAKQDWADFIVKEGIQGAATPNPPGNNGGSTQTPSYAAKRAAEYHKNLYGVTKEEM